MKASWFVAPVLVAFAAACSSSDNPTNPNDPGETPGGGNNGGGGPSTSTGPDTVYVNGVSFSPASLTVSPGDTVIWIKQDAGVTHTVTPNGHSAFSRAISSGTGEILRVVFSSAGSYPYFCEPHRAQDMTGTITVQ